MRILVAIALAVYSLIAGAQPLYEAKDDSVRIVLYDEPCALSEVTNLKLRAVWTEGGKDFEGCWAANVAIGVLMAYFSDKTVAAMPMRAFHRVVGV